MVINFTGITKRVYEGDYNKKVTEERSACRGEVEGPGPR